MNDKARPSTKPVLSSSKGSGAHILIVDDDEGTRKTLSVILDKKDYETEMAGTGEEALEKAQERSFNLALLDIKLPDMEGVELLAPLKEMHPDMVVIMATAYASLDTAVRALSEGASGYITKPLNIDEVLATVREALEKQRLVEDKRRAEGALRRHLNELTILHQASLASSQLLSPEAVGQKIIAALERLLNWQRGSIWVISESGQELHLLAHSNLGLRPEALQAELAHVRSLVTRLGQGISGWVALHGEPIRTGDVKSDPRYIEADPKTQSELCVPLKVGGRTIGSVNVESDQPDAFSEHDERLLTTLANQAAIAIENARLFEVTQKELAERKRAEEALEEERNLLRMLIDNLPDLIYVKDAEGRFVLGNIAVARLMGVTTPDDILGKTDFDYYPQELAAQYYADEQEIIRSGQPLISREEPFIDLVTGERGWLSTTKVPLRDGRGKAAGIVGIGRDITERAQHEREREAIVAVAAALRAAPTRTEMLPVILDQLLDLLNAEGAALALRDPVSGETVIELARGKWIYWSGERLPPGEGVSGQVIATGQSYLDNDMPVDPLFGRPDPSSSSGQAVGNDLRAVACAPLIAQEQTIGALWVGRYRPIAEAEVRLLTAIANMAANAIHRATLHEQTQRHLKQAQALHAIDQAITGSVDLRVTLGVLLDQATTQLGVHAADILLLKPHAHRLEYVAGRGFRSGVISRLRPRLGEGYAGRAALERRLVHVPDLRTAEPPFVRAPLAAAESFVAYYALPLVAKGQVQGVLELFHRAPLLPDPEWFEFLESLSAAAAIAVDNAALFDGLQRSNVELTLAYDITLEGWAQALEMRDVATAGHTRRVTETTLRLARALGMSKAEVVHARRGALLHDIGKMGIPDSILHKPGPLDDDEWDIMRQHPVYAYELLSAVAHLRPALDIPYCHHEKWDGSGYPRGLKGEQIPLAARVFTIADVWDALNSERPYRPSWPEEKAVGYIREQAGKHFDPQVVEMFMRLLKNGASDS